MTPVKGLQGQSSERYARDRPSNDRSWGGSRRDAPLPVVVAFEKVFEVGHATEPILFEPAVPASHQVPRGEARLRL
jgi:hypothetical protein